MIKYKRYNNKSNKNYTVYDYLKNININIY